jgi:hypothetical protein
MLLPNQPATVTLTAIQWQEVLEIMGVAPVAWIKSNPLMVEISAQANAAGMPKEEAAPEGAAPKTAVAAKS